MPSPYPVSIGYEVALLEERDRRDRNVREMAERMRPYADNIARTADLYPYATPAVVAGIGGSGMDPESSLAERFANMSLEDMLEQTSPFDAVPTGTPMTVRAIQQAEQSRFGTPEEPEPGLGGWTGVLKGGVRTLMAGAALPVEALGSLITGVGVGLLDDQPGILRTDVAQPQLVRAFFDWRDRGQETGDWSLNLFEQEYAGSGFFAEGRNLAAREEQKMQATVDGEWMSPGRLAATAINRGTGGRLLKAGSQEFNFASGLADAAFQIFGDPAGKVKVARVGNAADSDRLLDALRNAPVAGQGRQAVDAALLRGTLFGGNQAAHQLVRGLVDQSDAAEIARNFNFKITPEQAQGLAAARTAADVIDRLQDFLGTSVREVTGSQIRSISPGNRILPQRVTNWWDDSERVARFTRRFADIPGGGTGHVTVDLTDTPGALRSIDEWLVAAGTPKTRRNEILNRFMGPLSRARDDHHSYKTIRPLLKEVMLEGVRAYATARGGLDPAELAQRMKSVDSMLDQITTFGEGYITQGRQYAVDGMGKHIPIAGMEYVRTNPDGTKVTGRVRPGEELMLAEDGAVEVIPQALSPMFAQANGFRLPNTEDLYRESANWARMQEKGVPGAKMTESLHDWYMGRIQPVWQAVTILKPALMLRNMIENGLSMAQEGYIGFGGRAGDYLAAVAGWGGRDLDGNPFVAIDEVREKFAGMANLIQPGPRRGKRGITGRVRDPNWQAVDTRTPLGMVAWSRRIVALSQSADQRLLAQVGPEEWVRRWANDDPTVRSIMDEVNRMRPSGHERFDSAEMVQSWAEGHHRAMLEIVGGERNSALLGAIASGRFGDYDVVGGADKLDKKAVREIASWLEAEEFAEHAPLKVPARMDVDTTGDLFDAERSIFTRFFHTMVQEPEKKLAYIPVYNASYWDEALRLLPYATDEVAAQVRQAARANGNLITSSAGNLPTRIREKWFQRRGEQLLAEFDTAGSNGTNAIESFADFKALARSNAAERMSDVLMDVTQRSRFFEGIRVISPFANVYNDVRRRYLKRLSPTTAQGRARILRSVRMVERGVTSAKESDPFDFEFLGGEGDFSKGVGRGFFYVDENGENRFAYPTPLANTFGAFGGGMLGALTGSKIGIAAGALAGGAAMHFGTQTGGDNTDVSFTGDPASLNLVASSPLPGFGPTVQIPATFLLSGEDSESFMRQLLLPFGDARGGLDAVIPPAAQKAIDAALADPDTDERFGNLVGHVMQAMQVSGEWAHDSTLTPRENEQALLKEATQRARWLLATRAFAQASLPTSPIPEFTADTKAGEYTFSVLSREHRELREELGDYDAATEAFIELFGSNMLPLLQASTQEVNVRSMDPDGARWERDHPEQVENFSATIGYFAPHDPSGGLDFRAYNAALERGDRDQLAPRQQLWLYNNTVGTLIYQRVKESLGPLADRPEGRQQLRLLKADLMEEYPGYAQVDGIRRRASREQVLTELRLALDDPVLSDTDTGKALARWWPAYDDAMRAMAAAGYASLKNQSPEASYLREQLRVLGAQLAQRYPDFVEVWNRVLEDEVTADDDERLA